MVHENKSQASVIITEAIRPRPLEAGYTSPFIRESRTEALKDMNQLVEAFKKQFGSNCEGYIDNLPGHKFMARVTPVRNQNITSIAV